MDIVEFLFDVLRSHLPDEIIDIIVFKYRCIKHPVVNLLLNYTKSLWFENNQKTYLGLKINQAFNTLKKRDGDINQLIKQHLYNDVNRRRWARWEMDILKNCIDYGHYIKRPWGKLYYSIRNDNQPVQEGMNIMQWRLFRSKKCIDKIACNCEYRLKYYYNVNEEEVKRNSCIGSHIYYESVTKDLIYLENNFIKDGKFVCNYCKIDKDRFNMYHKKGKI